MSTYFVRRRLPVIIAFCIGVLTVAEYFLVQPTLTTMSKYVQSWGVVIWAFIMGMGIVNLVIRNLKIIDRRTPGRWHNSVILLAFLTVMSIAGIVWSPTNEVYTFLFNNFTIPLNTGVSSLLAFYVVSASYRAFKARNLEVTLLLIAACIVMLGNVTIGETIWAGSVGTRNWVMNVPNLAVSRGIGFGMALGVISLGIRTLLGYEKAALGMGGDEG